MSVKTEKSAAFWMTPEGEMCRIERSHIDFVFDNPGLFGVTKEELKAVYERHREPYRFEGKARNEIIRELVNAGWIRVRRYGEPVNSWTVQCRNRKGQAAEIGMIIGTARGLGLLCGGDRLRVTDNGGTYFREAAAEKELFIGGGQEGENDGE